MLAKRDASWCGRLEAEVRFQYIYDAPVGVPAFTTKAETACLPRSWGGTGLFVRFYRGQDYYNLGFGQDQPPSVRVHTTAGHVSELPDPAAVTWPFSPSRPYCPSKTLNAEPAEHAERTLTRTQLHGRLGKYGLETARTP
jgi:hypothetical protein